MSVPAGPNARSTSPPAARRAIYDPNATIAIIGMRGVGKTTLGLIAATSLRRSFIDCDAIFSTLYGPISTFVNTRGWSAFREAETQILAKLLSDHPKDYVIACGGGVVEREANRDLLKAFRERGGTIVHVVRDKDETVRYLVDETARPSWGEEIRQVWNRRTPYYEALCTHTIVSLTAYPPPPSPPFLMKHVETAFVRLLRSIFGLASSHVPLSAGPRPPPVSGPSSGEYGGYGACESEMGRGAKGPRTSFVALNFPDLRVVSADTVRKVAGGVDVIEMRVDTLVEIETPSTASSRATSPSIDMTPTGSLTSTPRRRRYPSLHFVTMSFGHLRRCSPLPILYTVRTARQGGAFPDPYTENPELMNEYLALIELGFKLGAEYVDLELALPDDVIQRFLEMRGAATQCLGADHDRKGEWKWDSEEVLDKYLRGARLGCDVVKLVSTPTSFDSNLELLKFRAKVDTLATPAGGNLISQPVPLLAINLGKGGQLSRYLNPVLTPVTHPLLPGVAAPGQLTYAQTQHALFLSGLILEKTFFVPSSAIATSFAREAHTLGLPYTFLVEDRLKMREIEPNYGGAYLGPPSSAISIATLASVDEVLPPARASGWADLSVPRYSEPRTYDTPPSPLSTHKYTNVRVLALAEVITHNLSPINAVGTHTCALLVGLSLKDTKEVIEALKTVGARWVYVLACESDESDPPTTRPPSHDLPSVSPSPTVQSRASSPQPPSLLPHQTPNRSSIPYPLLAPLNLIPISSFTSPTLYSKRPPTIIVSSDARCPGRFPEHLFASPTGGCALDLSLTSGSMQPAITSTVRTRSGKLAQAIEEKRYKAAQAAALASNSTLEHSIQGGPVFEDPASTTATTTGTPPISTTTATTATQKKKPVVGSNRLGRMDGWQVLGEKDLLAECERQAFRALTGRRMS
ncbi:uncharacterized protein JCM15063_001184 [Sporobolomyces koalae]|uniref:uncharacterized protein n=1 Tax=Sporobolomyces koalae TaxID=500713 RepID=UPI00317AEB9F